MTDWKNRLIRDVHLVIRVAETNPEVMTRIGGSKAAYLASVTELLKDHPDRVEIRGFRGSAVYGELRGAVGHGAVLRGGLGQVQDVGPGSEGVRNGSHGTKVHQDGPAQSPP